MNYFFVQAQKANEKTRKWQTEIQDMMDYYTQFPENFGIAIGVIDHGNNFDFYEGKISETNFEQADSASVFELGGLAKVFTATLLLEMENNGLVDFDAPINNYITFPFENQYLSQITIQQLLTHTSGLPKKPSNLKFYKTNENQPWENYDKAALYEYLDNYKPKELWSEGENFEYSDVGYALLGLVIENIEGEIPDFEQLNAISGHNTKGEKVANWNTPDFLSFSVNMNANLEFLMAYMQQILKADKANYFKKMLLPQAKTNNRKVKIAYAWQLVKARKMGWNVYTHAGSTTGFRSFIAFNPSENSAVIILANTNTKLIDNIGIQLLDLIVD